MIFIIIISLLVAGIGYSGYRLYEIWHEYHASAAEYAETAETFVASKPDKNKEQRAQQQDEDSEPTDSEADEIVLGDVQVFQEVPMSWGYSVNFENMQEINSDVCGWIDSPDTVIDYPVLKGNTSNSYLHLTWRGSYSSSGSIFTNAGSRGDLYDYKTILYGHHMKDGSMFRSIKNYTKQSYYEEHPYIWYVTPEAEYVLYVVASAVVSTKSSIYDTIDSVDAVQSLLQTFIEASDITADYELCGLLPEEIISNANRMVVLSTCSYEFTNARYVVVCVPLLAVGD